MYFHSYNFTYNEIKELNPKIAILPIGAFEQHGSHLPMITDTLIGVALAERICKKSKALLLPPITISCSQEHYGFYGNLFISAETLGKFIKDVLSSIKLSGIKQIAIINAHGGNYVLRNLAQELNLFEPQLLLWPTNHHWLTAINFAGIESTIHEDMHAGEIETSILLHLDSSLVRLDKINDHAASDRSYLHLKGLKEYTSSGVIGFPSLATAQKGDLLLESLVLSACKDLEEFRTSE